MILDGLFVNLGEPTKVLYEVSMSIGEQCNQTENTKISSSAVGYTGKYSEQGKALYMGKRCTL